MDPARHRRTWTVLTLLVGLTGVCLRWTGNDFGLPYALHPDERFVVRTAEGVSKSLGHGADLPEEEFKPYPPALGNQIGLLAAITSGDSLEPGEFRRIGRAWVLLLSVFFAWILMEAYGRYAVVTGETAIMAFRTRLRNGKILAILTIIGVVAGQWSALTGILGLISHALYEVSRLFFPGLSEFNYWAVLGIAIAIIIIMFSLLMIGRYSFFEKVLIFFQKALVSVLSGNAGQVLGDGSQQAQGRQAAVYIYPVIV